MVRHHGLAEFPLSTLGLAQEQRCGPGRHGQTGEMRDGHVANAGAPGDPSHVVPKLPVPPSLQTGRRPALHVSFGANCQWIQ